MGRGDIRPGQRVLVYGASSTSGTTAVQWARHLGAEVTGVCSTADLGLVESLDAHTVIDYTTVDALEPGDRYDFVLDAVGKARTSKLKESCRASVPGKDAYVSIDDDALKPDSARLAAMRDLVEAGHIRSVLDRCYPLEDIAEAHRYVEQGHKRGGVAVTVGRSQG
jgi:NADPH:quinone reductase-like Zn-dependent oxidoreductase